MRRTVGLAMLAVVAVAAAVVGAGTAGATPVSIDYTCVTGVPAVGDLSAPIEVDATVAPEPADAFDVVTYTADLALPELSPQPVAVNFNFFRLTFAVPDGMRAVKVKVLDPPSGNANPALSQIGAVVAGDTVVVDVPTTPAATRRFHFGTDGNFTYPFNTVTQSGGTAVVLPRVKIKAMTTYGTRSTTVAWPAPTVDTQTGFAGIGDIPCTPDDPGAALFTTHVTDQVDIPLNPYPDVSNGLDPAVSWARHLKVYKPTGTRFAPTTGVTRAEAVTALWNLVDRPQVGTSHPFTDVPATAPYRDALDWAVSEGVVTDSGNHRFKPTSPARRGPLVDLAFHTIHAQSGSPWPAFGYTDVPPGASYAEALRWADAEGVVNEYAGGSEVRPTVTASRADLVKLLHALASNDTWFRPLPTTALVAPV